MFSSDWWQTWNPHNQLQLTGKFLLRTYGSGSVDQRCRSWRHCCSECFVEVVRYCTGQIDWINFHTDLFLIEGRVIDTIKVTCESFSWIQCQLAEKTAKKLTVFSQEHKILREVTAGTNCISCRSNRERTPTLEIW